MPKKRVLPPTSWKDSEKFPPPAQRPHVINHFGLSGGKDSTRLAIWAKYESGYPPGSLDFSFCDTGNESPLTYQYIDYLEDALQVGITRVKPGRDFWELAKWKKRFPGATSRFCTQFLKIIPTLDYLNHFFADGHAVLLHSGVRAAESDARSKMLEREFDGNMLAEVYRPLLNMPIAEVWEGHHRYGVKPNPLYALGMARVGCFPCIMSRKSEIKAIAATFPEAVDKIREKEQCFDVGRALGGISTFFPNNTVPKRFRSLEYEGKDGRQHKLATIDDVVAWAQTSKGAKFDPRVYGELALEYDKLPEEAGRACGSHAGYCE